MAKTTKKKNRKLRRQIRKTVGALLMVSAITVAAIPVQDVSANPVDTAEAPKVAVTGFYTDVTPTDASYESTIPNVWDLGDGKNTIIYTSGDNTYQFAYVPAVKGSTTRIAVILGYSAGDRPNGELEIPSEMWAYRVLADNSSNTKYNCLVSKSNDFLYYETRVQSVDENNVPLYTVDDLYDENNNNERLIVNEKQCEYNQNGKLVYVVEIEERDEENNPVTRKEEHGITPVTEPYYNPCYYNQLKNWENFSDEELFYYNKTTGKYEHPNQDDNYYRIEAEVAYIGAEKIEEDPNNRGTWKLAGNAVNDKSRFRTKPDEGVFANQNNITTLRIGEKLRGISDYAFQGCSTLSGVDMSKINALETIGNGAFANCYRMTECNIAINSNVSAIGKDAFYNCGLTHFNMPIGVKAIGDCCFEACASLTEIDLCVDDDDIDSDKTHPLNKTSLKTIGNHAFKGCTALGSMAFPVNYAEELDINVFEGCKALQYVWVKNKDFNFVETKDANDEPIYSFETFKETVPESFYIIGPLPKEEDEEDEKTPIHETANDEAITFKYPYIDLYELVKEEKAVLNTSPDPAKVTYQVNSTGELVDVWIAGEPESITLPEKIGNFGIKIIGAGSFDNLCYLKKISIPASVETIGDAAFKGCHSLETVIFTDATKIQTIGTDAFKTQMVTCQDTLEKEPSLTFVGAMMNDAGGDTVPFIYAMNGISNINNPDQEKIWITCHSGWPTNLEVQYKYDPISNTGQAQLIGYPRYDMIQSPENAKVWVANLPYVTGAPKNPETYVPDANKPNENYDTYLAMVLNATRYYQASEEQKKTMDQPTENEMAIVNSALNVVIPNSVDCIKPGLFSGYVADADGELKDDEEDKSGEWDKVNNFDLYAKSGDDDTVSATAISKPDRDIQTIVINGVTTVEPYTFKNCTSLREAAIIGPSYISDYAFDGAKDDENTQRDADEPEDMSLQRVTLGTNLTDTGKRPFKGCKNLTLIECLDADFTYDNGILYRNTGSSKEIVECLEARGANGGIGSYSVGPEELAGVTTIKEEAFAGCDGFGKVDLSTTIVDTIPEGCFKETKGLTSVILPDTVKNVEAKSFQDSSIRLLTIPGTQSYIAQDAFMTGDWVEKPSDRETDPKTEKSKLQQNIVFECIEGTTSDRYAKAYWYINPEYGKVSLEHTVYFWDYPDYPDTTNKELFYKVKVKDGETAVPPTDAPSHEGYPFSRWTDYSNISRDTDVYPVFGSNVFVVTFLDRISGSVLKVEQVEDGKNATPPTEIPEHDGYTFKGWVPVDGYIGVTGDVTIIADFSDNSSNENRHKVVFYDWNGTVLDTQYVDNGDKARAPQNPTRSGYRFIGWAPSDFSNVTEDMTIVAIYEKGSGSDGSGSDGNGNGNSGNNGSGSSKATPSPSPTATPNPEDSIKKYTVSVSGGSGSGSYPAGAVVAINAYDMGEGQNFDKWTSSTAGVGFANPNATSTTFTMPASNVAITATYKPGSGSSSGGAAAASSGGGTAAANNNGSNNGTVVDVNRPGISNTNLAGATVSGSTDNFIVKVTEDQNATDAVVAALQAKYGDISRFKYLPMDISLYDSTGRIKIADTSGITVNLTLPLPDDLAQYAGNNRVAAVSNGALEDLNARFTTVDGVPCVNFTATHFSPYVIYVDTANLTEATIDATPKTGDPIHPKWFLALGLACISLILFFKRDKVVINTKTA